MRDNPVLYKFIHKMINFSVFYTSLNSIKHTVSQVNYSQVKFIREQGFWKFEQEVAGTGINIFSLP